MRSLYEGERERERGREREGPGAREGEREAERETGRERDVINLHLYLDTRCSIKSFGQRTASHLSKPPRS
jgi:hypothetical protein